MTENDPHLAWTPTTRELWQRLSDYRFGGDNPRAFLDRVAHACQSSRETADDALDEYRRFCFLAVVAGHEVTPSEIIDKVWHTHMTDTRDYWLRFCPQVLKRDLHHAPSAGGLSESARHQQQYLDTLEAYRHYFGEPPAAFWPPGRAQQRARHAARPGEARARVLTPWAAAPTRAGLGFWLWSVELATVFLLGAWVQGSANLLNWRGGAFLLFFVSAIFWASFAGGAIRRAMCGPNRRGTAVVEDRIELGFLAGGQERAADVAIVELMQRDVLILDFSGSARVAAENREQIWLRIDIANAARLPPSLRVAADIAVRDQNLGVALKALGRAYSHLAEPLRRKGWLLSEQAEWRARWMASVPMLALSVLGMMKIAIGMMRDKPVGFLVVLTILAVILAATRLLREQPRTRAGDWVLHDASQHLAGADAAQRAALMGTIGLVGTDCTEYHTLRTPVSSSGSDSGSSSSGSDGGGSCGGGGCGGCGGGGD